MTDKYEFVCMAEGHSHVSREEEIMCSAIFQIKALREALDEAGEVIGGLTARAAELEEINRKLASGYNTMLNERHGIPQACDGHCAIGECVCD